MIASKDTALSSMLHWNASATRWSLEKIVNRAAPPWPELASGTMNLSVDCESEYYVQMNIDVVAGTVQVFPPTGPASAVISDPDITAIAPVYGVYESLTDALIPGAPLAGWGSARMW